MKCHELESLLAMDDFDAKLDLEAVLDHVGSCQPCAVRWPEVGLLVGAAPAAAPRRRSTRRGAAKVVAAGLAAVAIAGMALHEPARSSGAAPMSPPRQTEAAPPRPAGSFLSQTTITFDRGQRYESRVTYEVWTAPTPACLKTGGSGS